jgi:hypothetical protein
MGKKEAAFGFRFVSPRTTIKKIKNTDMKKKKNRRGKR